jgi:hypothetical protein
VTLSPVVTMRSRSGIAWNSAGALDGCTLVTDCHWPTSAGLIDIERNSWTVQGDKITGTTARTYDDPSSGQACTWNENVTGRSSN